ncbi:DegT/DnrJ/EryC1/StrS aminotransferase family protein [Mesotoga sp. BH458_6_3_2_1]|uniref:DegT/DnrJ/EryC1/StrS family aminotransferase n=1 Tax=Mesotoga sp. BH458_6_3_2_1 TaxID=1437446 RepID=UPI000EF1F514|nr:DegT/DnrJ/EryC1/StrS family aminotransferase [Mesotoga sp. BH458_6_3_2_1]RLL85675.1 Pleiotropic regulatory protein [Mesotoga sp. BH458_6_3_2_1]
MHIPLFDLTRQYSDLREELLGKIDEALLGGRVILGEAVKELEKSIADLIGVKHAIGVANGSDALLIAVAALGIGPGDYVITTPYTFFATVSSITRNGATPLFADIDPITYNIDLDKVEELLQIHPERERIKAIIPVHLFGQSMELGRLENIREIYGVKIIEDCAQSIGASWSYPDGSTVMTGSIGDLSTFSFFPTKNLGAYGDGGMITTDDDELAAFCRSYRVHGSPVKYVHDMIGINSRLDELQAIVLNTKLKHLQEYERRRIEIASKYAEHFERAGLGFGVSSMDEDQFLSDNTQQMTKDRSSHNAQPTTYSDVVIHCPSAPYSMNGEPRTANDYCFSHVFHQYVVRFEGFSREQRDSLRDYLAEQGIGTSIYYPMGLHQQKCFAYLGVPTGALPETEMACEETLALPIFPEMTDEEIKYVVDKIAESVTNER